jgi:glucose-6-phosphate isomerase
MLTKKINFKGFRSKKNNKNIKSDLQLLLKENNKALMSLSVSYKNNYKKKIIINLKKYPYARIIGMGGSILGSECIYNFLKHKVKKKFYFVNNLITNINFFKKKKIYINLIISKSGETLETISNVNIIVKKTDKNIFITENRKSYLLTLAQKLKAEIVHHNNFIGGRYSVLSEVGMLPAELMGLNANKFKQINSLIRSKNFINQLTNNVSNTLYFLKQKKFNSIILNYDERSESLFKWYQQLIAESLGKKNNGILPIVSSMPKDNHSLMQYYLDGPKKNFFTFFSAKEKNSPKIINNKILSSHAYLRNKNMNQIMNSQKIATENVFTKKGIPFRSFEILTREEQTLGELFCFFILETILIGRALKINPFDQPAVESIKKETKKILI